MRLFSTDLRIRHRATAAPNMSSAVPSSAAPVDSAAVALFDAFSTANTFHSILDAFQQLRDVLELRTAASASCSGGCSMLRQLAAKLTPSWRAQSLLSKLEKRAGNWEYRKGTACSATRVCLFLFVILVVYLFNCAWSVCVFKRGFGIFTLFRLITFNFHSF